MSTRRHFIKTVTMAGAAAFLLRGRAWPYGSSPTNLKKFIQALPGLGPAGANELGNYIPVATPNRTAITGVDYYQFNIEQFTQQMHPHLRNATKLWGYVDPAQGAGRYLGPALVATENRPVQITFTNNLPNSLILPVDTTLPGASAAVNRAAVHLHGGFTPWITDGGPMAWFDPVGNTGMSFMNNQVLNPSARPGQAEYYYPNQQSARLMWYHDHAMGITRLNAYAGIAAPYIITDGLEARLQSMGLLPADEIPLILQDKSFFDGGKSDPDYPVSGAVEGDLWYPWDYDPSIWELNGGTPPSISCVPEAFFDTIVVNGAVYPYVNVDRKTYRLRILNASQARFYNLRLFYAQESAKSEADTTKAGPPILQIGTEGGFLPAPVWFRDNTAFSASFNSDGDFIPGSLHYNLLLAPAERADIIIDFSGCPSGSTLILYNDANAPFPGGDSPVESRNSSPDVRSLLQFRVTNKTGPALTDAVVSGLTRHLAGSAPAPLTSRTIRKLTLNEDFDSYGRLIQMLGTTDQTRLTSEGEPFYGRAYTDTPTEVVRAGSTEIWRIFNLTGDTHPIHFHLVNVQVLGRAPFTDFNSIGPFSPPDPNERGWKETVRMNPGEVTDVIAKFSLPRVPFKVPASPMGGNEYVWHCHILEHEEHDMMHSLIVK